MMTLPFIYWACFDGPLRKVMVVVKIRGGNHNKDILEYVINDKGVVVIGSRQTDYTGRTHEACLHPRRRNRINPPPPS